VDGFAVVVVVTVVFGIAVVGFLVCGTYTVVFGVAFVVCGTYTVVGGI